MDLSDISLVIFDCDGTLVDTEPLTARLMTNMLNDLGIQISLEECTAKFIGTKFSDVVNFVTENGLTVEPQKFESEYRLKCKDVFYRELEPIPGVNEMLRNLNIPYCIASNGPKEKMEITLKTSGLIPFFPSDRIYSAYDINKWKPAPDLFLTAAHMMKYDPMNCLVIEDTIHGIKAAITAEMKVIGINIKHDKKEIEDLGITTFDSITGLSSKFKEAGLFG